MNEILGSLEEILNCRVAGFHQYRLEVPVHLTYASQNLCDMLGCSPEELLTEYTDGYGSFVHPADRHIYADFLGQLSEKEQTVTVNYRMIRRDGEVHLVRDTAVSRCLTDGRWIADSVLTDITEKEGYAGDGALGQYLSALTEVYDKIFEYDFAKQTVKCISGQKSDRFRPIQNIPMHLEQATEQWIEANVCGEDRARVLGFFADYYQQMAGGIDGPPPQIWYRALSSRGETRMYAGIFLKVNTSLSLFCCRRAQVEPEASALLQENQSLKSINESMQELVRRFTDGAVTFDAEHYLENIEEDVQPRVYIRTFGYFDVFVDDKPIAFRNEKAKELFALLVDRRGGYVTSEEAIGFLWEDETANPVTFARYRKVALRLKNILEEYGISDIVDSVNGRRRLVAERVQCDLYGYLSQKEEYAQLFKGSYLTNYSWGENTLGELLGEHTS